MILSTLVLGALLGAPQSVSASPKPTLYYVPHTHWEGAVFETREEYLRDGLEHILEALRLMDEYPEYTFALDQVAYFKPFLERYPEQAAKFRKYVKEGRLEIVGGMDVMPDDVKVGGELFVRQMQYGKAYCRKELGIDVDVAWMLDTFGHSPQLPQLLEQAGFKSFWFCRGVPSDTGPSAFLLRGIDGTTIPTFWIAGFYGLFYGPPRDQKGFDKFFVDRFNFMDPTARGPERIGLAGNDVSEPEDYVTPLLRAFNKDPESPFTIRYSVPSEFAKVVAKQKDTPVESYDLNPIFPGTYSSRVELRQTARSLETQLLDAEQLSALADWTGAAPNDSELWQAWEPVLFNQTHDLASGTMNDHVYADTVKSYNYAKRLGDEILADRWAAFSSHIDTSGAGSPIVVYNPQGSIRTDVAEVELGFADAGVAGFKLVDSRGEAIPTQISSVSTYGDGAPRQVKLAYLARDVPACGYAVYHVVPDSGAVKVNGASELGSSIENEYYKVTIDVKTGAVTSVFDKEQGVEMLSSPGNVVARTEDKGDLWTLYHPLDGTEHLPNLLHQPVPKGGSTLLSTDGAEKDGTVLQGPVFSEFAVSHNFGKGQFSTRVRLTRGVRRIDFETEIVNNDRHVRYQVLFPTAITSGRNTQEVPFGAIERPSGIEYPAQNWVDYSDGSRGLALLNEAMPGNLVTDGAMMLSLLRSVNLGDYNGGDSSDTGYELNVPRTFRYALVPHAGDWRSAGLAQAGQEFNSPLLAFKVEPHHGSLPARWSVVHIAEPNVLITSVKPGPDGTLIVRLYETTGRATKGAKLEFGARVLSAAETNLLETSSAKLGVDGNTVAIDLHPYEIKTIKLRLGRGK